MTVRVVSGIFAACLLFPAAWAGGWWFAALAFPALAVCLIEYFTVTLPADGISVGVGTMLGLALVVFITTGGMTTAEGALGAWSVSILVPTLWFLLRTGDIQTAASRMGLMVLGLAWIAVLGATCTSLVLLEEGYGWLILGAVMAFGSDMGAFFVGRWLGRHPLYPKVSPKKTWEGALGGILMATAMAYGFKAVLGPSSVGWVELGILTPIGAILGQLGDLSESLLKRSAGVKDSGTVMPGHGGLFDRIDALLFIGPPLFLYARVRLDISVTWLPL